jgi:hypothetical protein
MKRGNFIEEGHNGLIITKGESSNTAEQWTHPNSQGVEEAADDDRTRFLSQRAIQDPENGVQSHTHRSTMLIFR